MRPPLFHSSWQNDPLCDDGFPRTFDEVKRTIENCRQQKYGKPPQNCEEIQREFAKKEIYESLGLSLHQDRGVFFNTVQFGDGFENCIFSSSKSISLIKEHINEENRFFLMDATFRVTPRSNFTQFLVIHIQFGKKTFPIIYVLMSRKTTAAYLSVLRYVNDNLIPIVGEGIIIDFEKAERLALAKLNTGISILGCWFHFCQCLRKKLATIGDLFQLCREDVKAKEIFSQFQCLPLLPADVIEITFKELAKKALRTSLKFATFVDYFDREWIKIVKPKHFSVFMRGTKTTGAAENFNHQMNARFKTHANLYHFCESLLKEEVVIAESLRNYIEGSMQKIKMPKFYRKRNRAIKKYSKMLQNEEISPMMFLTTMANRKNHIVYEEIDISVEEAEIEGNQSDLFGGDDETVYKEYPLDDMSEDSSDGESIELATQNIQGKSLWL